MEDCKITTMSNKLIQTTKILFILIVSYGCTRLTGYLFFPNNAPQINIKNVEYLAQSIKDKPKQFLALFNRNSYKTLDTSDLSKFKMVSKGVYAKEENGITATVVNQDEVGVIKYSVVYEGKPLTINVPVNSVPKEEMERVLNEMKGYKRAN